MSSDDAVWAALLQQRERALRVARARCASAQDAEDCVQEAMVRVAGMSQVDLARVGPLLSTVVANLAVDGHRSRARAAKAHARMQGWRRTEPPVDEQVCDEHEARWLWSRCGGLAVQDRRVLELRAQGLTVTQTAEALGLTYKAAEASLTRARSRLKGIWRAAGGLFGILWWRPERQLRTATVAAVAAAGAVLTLNAVPPDASGGGPTGAPQVSPSAVEPARAVVPGERVAPRPAAAIRPARPAPTAPVAVRERAPEPATPRPQPSTVPVFSTGRVQTGPVSGGASGQFEHPEESFTDTLQRCLEQGAVVTPYHVECNEDE